MLKNAHIWSMGAALMRAPGAVVGAQTNPASGGFPDGEEWEIDRSVKNGVPASAPNAISGIALVVRMNPFTGARAVNSVD